ncbi:MAG: hypothetical protein AAF549_08335 [Pseudomonadota bacterium]
MIKLAQSSDGRLIIVSNRPFPADIERVEYYRDQKYFMFTYEGQDEDELMPCEIDENVDKIVRHSPDVVVVAMSEDGREPYGYEAPLVQIGL